MAKELTPFEIAERDGWAEYIKTDADRLAVEQGYWFDVERAERVCEFFETYLRHSKGSQFAGQLFVLQDWQRYEVIYPLFGWVDAEGLRRYRRAFIFIPKKNGKTTLCAGFALYGLLIDDKGAEVYSAAVDRKQAGYIFDEAAGMVAKSAELQELVEVIPYSKTIAYPQERSKYQVLSKETGSREGLNASMILMDEIHVWTDKKLYSSLTYAGSSRLQPLTIIITTAGENTEGIGYTEYQYAKAVEEGTTHDLSYFAFIREAPKDADWTDPATWYLANPSLGVTITEKSFRLDFTTASNTPHGESDFRRYKLNQWIGGKEDRWLNVQKWDSCGGLNRESLLGMPCYLGLDLASTLDVCAVSLVFPLGDDLFATFQEFWIPEEAAKERERQNRDKLTHWVDSGELHATPGNGVDYGFIKQRILELGRQYEIKQVASDQWNATQLCQELMAEGLDVVYIGQNFTELSEPSKKLEELILNGKIKHDGNGVMRWMISNVVTMSDSNANIRPNKKKARDKIDGVVAMIMGLKLAMVGDSGSVYDKPGSVLSF